MSVEINNGRKQKDQASQMTDRGHTFMFGSLGRENLFSFRDGLAQYKLSLAVYENSLV